MPYGHYAIQQNPERYDRLKDIYVARAKAPEASLKKQAIKNFLCEACGNHFMTLVLKNSTVICSKCASIKVQEVIESPKPAALDGNHKDKSEPNQYLDGKQKPQTSYPAAHV